MSASVFTKMSWAKKCRQSWERAIEIAPANLEARFELLRYYLMAPGIAGGSVEKARDQARKLAPLDATQGHIADGMVADHEKQPAAAEAAYRKAVGTDTTGRQGPIALASFYSRQKRWAEARAVFEKRVAADPDDAFAIYQLGRKPAAIAEYREALKADPAHSGANRELERLKAA